MNKTRRKGYNYLVKEVRTIIKIYGNIEGLNKDLKLLVVQINENRRK